MGGPTSMWSPMAGCSGYRPSPFTHHASLVQFFLIKSLIHHTMKWKILCRKISCSECWLFGKTIHHLIYTDYKYWPWDEQQCYIVIGSWTKTGEELDIINMSGRNVTNVFTGVYTPTIWHIKTATASRNQRNFGTYSTYPDITVKLRLKRQSYVDQKIAVLPIIRRA